MRTPEQIKQYEPDYLPNAWHGYTPEELRWWVHLLSKRAGMRTDPAKAAKDLTDAGNYWAMLRAMERSTASHPAPQSGSGMHHKTPIARSETAPESSGKEGERDV